MKLDEKNVFKIQPHFENKPPRRCRAVKLMSAYQP